MAKDKKNTSDTAAASEQEESNTKSTSKKADASDKKSEKKSKKADKKADKKPNVFQRIGKWFHDLKVEFKNVTWPTRDTVVTNTSVVLAVIVMGSVIIGLIDSGLFRLVQFLIDAAQN